MIFKCLRSGFTVGNKLYKKGEMVEIKGTFLKEFEGLDSKQLAAKQQEMYHEILFEIPTLEQVAEAYRNKEVTLSMLDEKQRNSLSSGIEGRTEKLKAVTETLKKEK
ncbi:hypothetical protein ES703_23501 [subsurface metagenome]